MIYRSTTIKFLVLASTLAVAITRRADEPMKLWSKPGKGGFSCMSCHTPSGREIWDSRISLADVKRRSLKHLSEEDTAALVEEVRAMRESVPTRSIYPRPLQPKAADPKGGTVEEQDDAFGRSLSEIVPKLYRVDVWTLREADAAVVDITDQPMDQVMPGFPLDPVSRDVVRPLDGPPIADWIPDIPLSPAGTEVFAKACQEKRTPDGDYDIDAINAAVNAVEGPTKNNFELLSRLKRLSLLRYEDFLRTGKRPAPFHTAALPEDPIWAIGRLVGRTPVGPPEAWGMDEATARAAGLVPNSTMNLWPMALSWLWIGWSIDPSMQLTAEDRFTKAGFYLGKTLWAAGPYPWHAAYFAARRPAEEWLATGQKAAYRPEFSAFVGHDVLEANHPKSADSLAQFVHFCANMLRMDCLLLERDLKAGKKLVYPGEAREQLEQLWAFVKPRLSGVDAKKTEAIVDRAVSLLPAN